MKITKTQLKRIIKEELKTVIGEGMPQPGAAPGMATAPDSPPDWRTGGQGITDEEAEAVKQKIGPDKLEQMMSGVGSAASMVGMGAVEFLNFLVFMATAGGIDLAPDEKMPRPPGYMPDPLDKQGIYQESINRDKLATLVAEEVRKILKNK